MAQARPVDLASLLVIMVATMTLKMEMEMMMMMMMVGGDEDGGNQIMMNGLLCVHVQGRTNGMAPSSARLSAAYEREGFQPPQRRAGLDFSKYSWVLSHKLT